MFSNSNKAILISVFLSSLVSLGLNFLPDLINYTKFWYVSVLFHALSSFLLHFLLFRNSSDERDNTIKIMFASMGHLLLCMFALLIYKLSDKLNFTQFAVHFMLHYILFTVIQIRYLLTFINTKKND